MAASTPRFGRLHQEKLHEQALEHIREALITGDYLPGDRLRESDIAEQMGISRGPIREAFRQLEQEGLIVSQPHRGTYVTTTSDEELEHLMALRTLLAPLGPPSQYCPPSADQFTPLPDMPETP